MANTPLVPLEDNMGAEMRTINLAANATTGRPADALGQFAAQPFLSPKYARHRQNRNHEFEDTMARMFIKVAPDLYEQFLASLDDAETRAIAEVLAGDDVKQGGHGYIDFLLQNANHNFEEKFQVAETLADSYVAFFFGHAPPMFQYSGTLFNSYQDDWTMRMFRIFRDLARGTQLARRGLILRLKYDSMIVAGAMTNFQWTTTAGAQTYTPFSFNLLVKSIHVIYGGMSPPTRFDRQQAFTPANFQLVGAGVGERAATQTYLGSPPGLPAGLRNEEQLDYGQSVPDETGTSYAKPLLYEEVLGIEGYTANTQTPEGESGSSEIDPNVIQGESGGASGSF
jgi:hypothetical protein